MLLLILIGVLGIVTTLGIKNIDDAETFAGIAVVFTIVLVFTYVLSCYLLDTNKQTWYVISNQTEYNYSVDLTRNDIDKAILIEKAGGKPVFIKWKADSMKGKKTLWVWPLTNEKSEKYKWTVDVYKEEK